MSGMSESFLSYIVSNIDDDTPRLVYADWCDENGQPERAEFIRVQVERTRLPAWDAAQVKLRLRETQLLDEFGERWLAEVPAVTGARWQGFRRGIVAEVSFASFESMRKNAHACRAVAPVEAVTVRWPRREERQGKSPKPIAELRELVLTGYPEYESFAWLAESPQLATLRKLTARGVFSDLPALLASPHLGNLRALHLPTNGLGNDGFTALARSALTALEELDLSSAGRHERYSEDDPIRTASVRALIDWPGLASVRSLKLAGQDLNRDGLRTVLLSPHAAGLKELSLRDTRLTGTAMAEFESAVAGLSLDVLDVGQNILKSVGAEYIALAPCLRELKVLRMDRCEIPSDGASLFAKKATFLDGVRTLDVGHNHFRQPGLTALLDRAPPELHTLSLRDNDLFDAGAELLAGSHMSDTLRELDLSRNGLAAAAAKVLGDSPHLRELLVLRAGDNPLGKSAAKSLAASPLGRRLAVLDLDNQPEPQELDDEDY